jgi:hypothetical protein
MYAFCLFCKYLNCFISHEILILLRNIHQVIRCDPPSLLKVTLQATCVYLFSIFVFTIHCVVGGYYYAVNIAWSIMVAFLFPILFFVYVLITIKCHGYMSSVTGRMKELVSILFYPATYFSLPKYNTLNDHDLVSCFFFLNIYLISRYGTSSVLCL